MNIGTSLREIQSILNAPEIGPEELIKCALGIKTTEIQAYCTLVNAGPLTIQDATDLLSKSRSTAQRLLQNLVEKGLATREEELIGLGGYKFIYRAVPPKRLRDSIRETLEKWYERMISELDELPQRIAEMGCDVEKK
ncbi:helix-turn-helix domain-containing protein [Candidatus Bathyarchaeota archaeon]|nr:helix-turn-helix domain-containing protein [Candidatus Bathyarchaeota archaeon]